MRLVMLYVCALAMLLCGPAAVGQTALTYQGELAESGAPADGEYQMEFSLWTERSRGVQVGPTVTLPAVQVAGGLFTVKLDFGAEVFDNADRWLQIAVEGVTLGARQQITRSPYAIQTRGIFVDDDENVGIGTTRPDAKLDVAGPVAIDGPLSVNHNAPTEQIDVNGSILARSRLLAGYPDRFFWADPAQEFVGIGRTTQVSGSEIFGTGSTTNVFSGMYIQTGALGEPFYGYSAGGDIDAYHYFDGDDNHWKLNLQGGDVLRIDGANGAATFSGRISQGPSGTGAPVAYGTINGFGSIEGGRGIFQLEHNDDGIYWLTLAEPYGFATHAAIVTAADSSNAVFRVDDDGTGRLIVKGFFQNQSWRGDFHFVVYRY